MGNGGFRAWHSPCQHRLTAAVVPTLDAQEEPDPVNSIWLSQPIRDQGWGPETPPLSAELIWPLIGSGGEAAAVLRDVPGDAETSSGSKESSKPIARQIVSVNTRRVSKHKGTDVREGTCREKWGYQGWEWCKNWGQDKQNPSTTCMNLQKAHWSRKNETWLSLSVINKCVYFHNCKEAPELVPNHPGRK